MAFHLVRLGYFLGNSYVTVETLQRLAGKCVSFSRAVPAARLFSREMNAAISQGLRYQKVVLLHGALRGEISHWLFLESWDDPLPWRDERHVQISVSTDVSASGWGAAVISPFRQEVSDYWSNGMRNYPGIWRSITLCCHVGIKCATCG